MSGQCPSPALRLWLLDAGNRDGNKKCSCPKRWCFRVSLYAGSVVYQCACIQSVCAINEGVSLCGQWVCGSQYGNQSVWVVSGCV